MFFEIYESTDTLEFWWEAKSEDERTLCSSERMPSREICLAAILIVKHSAAGASVYDHGGKPSGPIQKRRVVL